MIKTAIFDMYETLITLFDSPLYFSTQISADLGIDLMKFREIWDTEETERSIGKRSLENVLEQIMTENQC